MVDRITCPESARLPRLLRDDGRDDEPLAGHLARCDRCQDALERLAVGAAEWLRANREEPADRPESLRATIDALKAMTVADCPPAPAEQPDAIGPYPVLTVVGRGGMGVVYKALDPPLNRVIAVKVLAPEWSANGTARQRFLREARAAAAVAHDNVVTIHAVEGEGDPPYLVMEYVSGLSLQERIDRDGPLSPADAARVGVQTADGLAAAHSQGLVHRDVKPANILIENGVGRVKLSDFGLARAVDDAGWTAHGTVLGTPEYMAPEQAAGEAIDARADLFSLGCVLYAALTGLPPFRASSTLGVLHRVTTAAPRPVRAVNPAVPAALEEVVMKLLAKNPAHRFASAADTAEAFRRALVQMQLPAPAKPPRRRRGLVAAGFAALLLLAAGAVFRFSTARGTLVVEIDDSANSARVEKDGDAVVITGVGVHEVRLKPGDYRATKVGPGGAAAPEVVTIERNGRTVLKVHFEPTPPAPIAPALAVQPVPANPTPLRTFEGHTGTVRQIVLLPDGKGFVSSSGWPDGDGTIRIWDYVTGKTVRVLRGHDGNIDALAVTADGKVIISGGQDGTIRAWDTATGREIWRAAAHTQVVTSVDISPDGKHLASSGREGTIKLSDISTGKAIRQWKAHPSICRYVRYTPDGKRLVSCGYDGTVRTWNPETGQQLKSFAVRRGGPKPVPVSRLAITPDGKTLLTADAAVGVWDLDTEKELRTIRGFAGPTNVSVSPDGRRFAVCGYDGRARLYDLGDGALRRVLPAVPGWSWAATFAADGKTLLTGGGPPQNPHEVPPGVYTIKMWSIDNSGARR